MFSDNGRLLRLRVRIDTEQRHSFVLASLKVRSANRVMICSLEARPDPHTTYYDTAL